jgi:Ankyrin repeats (3 copies)
MLAVKRGHIKATRAILDFGVDPAIVLMKDANGSTPLHIAVQSSNTALAEVLLQHGPAELLYTENSVGQTPLDIAGLKDLPRVTVSVGVRRPNELQTNPEQQVASLQRAPFDVKKQEVEIPKLRATLNMLFAEGRLVHGTKLATELLAFADHMEEKLATEVARKSVVNKDAEEAEDYTVTPKGTAAQTYAVLRDVAAARPGFRQLVHLADVQRSVQRNLTRTQTVISWSRCMRESNEESKEVDPEEQRGVQLKLRSLFFNYNNQKILFGEDNI